MKEKTIPGIGDILLLFSVLLIVLIFIGSIVTLKFGLWGTLFQQILLALITLVYCIYIKSDIKKLFSFNRPNWLSLLGGIISWIGAFFLMLILSLIFSAIFPESASSLNDSFSELLGNKNIFFIVLVIAFAPAVCEEIVFRGFLLGSLSDKLKPWPLIVTVGLVFGAYHMNIAKLFVVGFLGTVFAYVVYKTKSIFISMFMHFLNNITAVFISLYPEYISKILPFISNDNMTIIDLFFIALTGIILLLIGVKLIKKTSK